MRSLVLGALLLAASPASAAEPWFVRTDCLEATALAYAAHVDQAMARATAMRDAKDLDARACGLWLLVSATEMQIALYDDEEKLLELLKTRISDLEAFGVENGYRSPRFDDLVLEAKLRRVHLMVRLGERTEAIRAVKEAQRLLERRRRIKKKTPTYFYAEGVANLALTHADWPVRAVLTLVGIQGDEARGTKAMKILLGANSVYRPEATVVARNFEIGPRLDLSKSLWSEFPDNPQLAFNLAVDLQSAQRCPEANTTLARVSLAGYGQKIRRKVTGILDACKGSPSR